MAASTNAINALMNSAQSSAAFASQTAKAQATAKESIDIAKAEGAARDFEAVFASEMLKPMFEGIKTDGMFGGGKGEEVFRSMMIDEFGKIIAQNDSFGLAGQVKQQMIAMQEQANRGTQNAR